MYDILTALKRELELATYTDVTGTNLLPLDSENDRFCKACNKAMNIINYAERTATAIAEY
jgi:hypothetical protein